MENTNEKNDQLSLHSENAQAGIAEVKPVGPVDSQCEQGTRDVVDGSDECPYDSQPLQDVPVDDARVDQGAADETGEDGDEPRGGESRPADDRESSQRLLALISCDARVGHFITSLLNGESADDAIAHLAATLSREKPVPEPEPGVYELVRYGTPPEPAVPDDENTARVLASLRPSVWNAAGPAALPRFKV